MTQATVSSRQPPFGAKVRASRRAGVGPPPGIVVIGASTGGPQALITLMTGLAPVVPRLPVCVTLHMPPDVMPVIAAHVARACGIETCVVTEARRLDVGLVHFAPGDKHITFQRSASNVIIAPTQGAPGDLCTPAIDVMFASAAACHGARVLGIVLSGMGRDGFDGACAIVAAGGTVLVQDKASSAVWGMPGAVAGADLAAAILEPGAIAKEVLRRMRPLTRTA